MISLPRLWASSLNLISGSAVCGCMNKVNGFIPWLNTNSTSMNVHFSGILFPKRGWILVKPRCFLASTLTEGWRYVHAFDRPDAQHFQNLFLDRTIELAWWTVNDRSCKWVPAACSPSFIVFSSRLQLCVKYANDLDLQTWLEAGGLLDLIIMAWYGMWRSRGYCQRLKNTSAIIKWGLQTVSIPDKLLWAV